jgi:hypothetical protein
MTPNEIADNISLPNCHLSCAERKSIANLLRQQEQKIEKLKTDLHNVIVSSAKKIEQLKQDAKDCTCQGGHSEAYLKAKGRL